MIALTGTSDVITAVLAAPPATTQPSFVASFADTPSSSINGSAGALNGTTPVNVVGSPASGVTRAVRMFSIFNADTAAVTVTVRTTVGGVTSTLCKITLAVGYTLMYEGGIGLRVTDASGNFLELVQAQQSGSWTVSATNGVVNAGNSTTTTLAANGTYTGSSVSVLGYSNVEVIIYSDVASAANGLLIEFSSDGTNWDDSSPFTYTPGTAGPNQGQAFIAGVRAQFMRVVYTNGATIQTTFRLQTVLKTNIIGGDVLSINGTINDNNHGFLTVSQIVGKTTGGGGGYVPVKVNPSGAVTVENNMTQMGGSNVTLGQKTMAASMPVVIASDQSNVPENLTQVGGSSITLGQKSMASSLPVSIASDQYAIAILSAQLTTTTATSLGGAIFTSIKAISVVLNGGTLASGNVVVTVKDGSGNSVLSLNVPTFTSAPTNAPPVVVFSLDLINISLNNAGGNITVQLSSNLTSGSITPYLMVR